MEKLQKDHHYQMTEKCERVQISIGNLDLFVIQNDQGIILDVYPLDNDSDLIDTFTVWFDDVADI